MSYIVNIEETKMKIKSFLNKNKSMITWVLILFAFRWSFADHYRVPTESMYPTIKPGDHLFTNKMAYDFKLPFTDVVLVHNDGPKRGEVIVFLYPKDTSINFVKRVVGLPGETVRIVDHQIYINGTALDESYLTPEARASLTTEYDGEVVVPKDMYFVMGDNRGNSLDSRYWGFVPRSLIKGRALEVLYNVGLQGWIPVVDIKRFLLPLKG